MKKNILIILILSFSLSNFGCATMNSSTQRNENTSAQSTNTKIKKPEEKPSTLMLIGGYILGFALGSALAGG